MKRAIATAALAAGIALGVLPARAMPEMVVDLSSGRILHAIDASESWHPASLTKMMTAWVALRMIESGQATLASALTVSPAAARTPPAKLGLPAGFTITLEDALRIILVRSANDVAVTIAEGLGGDLRSFAGMMNSEAAALGMTASHFVNPHGLHDPAQVTTARDMAVLATAIVARFPQHAHMFGIHAISHAGAVHANTNGLIGKLPHVTGMKTGYICASGFNLVATAERDGRRVAAVVFGHRTQVDRNARAALLIEAALRGQLAGAQEPPRRTAPAAARDMRGQICGANRGVPATLGEAEARWRSEFTAMPRRLQAPIPVATRRAASASAVTAPQPSSRAAAPPASTGVASNQAPEVARRRF